jgi:hypothetical protein
MIGKTITRQFWPVYGNAITDTSVEVDLIDEITSS